MSAPGSVPPLLQVAATSRSSAAPTESGAEGTDAAPAATSEPSEDEAREQGPACVVDDPGTGDRREVDLGVAGARLFAPARVPERFPLVVHFHGGEAARRLLVRDAVDVVLVTIDAGKGSQRYANAITNDVPRRLVQAVEDKTGRAIGKVVVSAWSAGYGAVRSMLSGAPDFAQAYVLLDAVHSSYDAKGAPEPAGLAPFVDVAKRAKLGSPIVWLTHSSITPPGYASTTEVADAILTNVEGRRRYGGLEDLEGLELRTRYDAGSLHVLGTTGTDKSAHCAHLRMLPGLLEREVLPQLAR